MTWAERQAEGNVPRFQMLLNIDNKFSNTG